MKKFEIPQKNDVRDEKSPSITVFSAKNVSRR
jgi:hypothetical protein